jgi:hypothetical protein
MVKNITVEKRQEYYKNFIKNNKDKVKEKIICPLCSGKYDYYNKSKHNQTIKHLLHNQINEIKKNKLIS